MTATASADFGLDVQYSFRMCHIVVKADNSVDVLAIFSALFISRNRIGDRRINKKIAPGKTKPRISKRKFSSFDRKSFIGEGFNGSERKVLNLVCVVPVVILKLINTHPLILNMGC